MVADSRTKTTLTLFLMVPLPKLIWSSWLACVTNLFILAQYPLTPNHGVSASKLHVPLVYYDQARLNIRWSQNVISHWTLSRLWKAINFHCLAKASYHIRRFSKAFSTLLLNLAGCKQKSNWRKSNVYVSFVLLHERFHIVLFTVF